MKVIILHTEQRGSNPFLVYLYYIDTSRIVIYITYRILLYPRIVCTRLFTYA